MEEVWALDIDRATSEYRRENTGQLCILLPSGKNEREQIFNFASEIAEEQGFDATPDMGQKYLFMSLD